MIKKRMAGKEVSKIGKAEVNISGIVFCYTLAAVVGLAPMTFFEFNRTDERISELVVCESSGNRDCSDIDLSTFEAASALLFVSMVIITSFFPIMAIVFSFDPQSCKRTKGQS